MRARRKSRLSVTVDAGLVDELDRRQRGGALYPTRSAAVESALELWLERERDREIEAYYNGQSSEERSEDRAWAEDVARALLVHLDEDEAKELPAPARRSRRRASR